MSRYRAFSLIELMVAVSILSIGIILIARSFLSASGALDIAEHKILAMGLLESKMSDMKEKILQKEEPSTAAALEIQLGNKKAIFKSSMEDIAIGEEKDKEIISMITLTAGWKEGSRAYDEVLATYVEKEKQ